MEREPSIHASQVDLQVSVYLNLTHVLSRSARSTPGLSCILKDIRANIEKYFQDRQYFKDPVKAKTKKRYVAGLREIKKYLIVKKITALLIAPGTVII